MGPKMLLSGAASNWCIRATAYGAPDGTDDFTLIEAADPTGTIELEDGARIETAAIIMELNIAVARHSCPGLMNGAASAEKVNFAISGGI